MKPCDGLCFDGSGLLGFCKLSLTPLLHRTKARARWISAAVEGGAAPASMVGGGFGQGGGGFGQQGGGFGQGGGGRGGGGRGNRVNFDPSQMQGMMERFKAMGGGQQMDPQQMMQMWGKGGGGRGNRGSGGWGGAGGGPSWGGTPGAWGGATAAADPMANMADMRCRRIDQNGQGLLNFA